MIDIDGSVYKFILLTRVCFHQDLEKVLDVFNITLARQQAHMEVNMMKTELQTQSPVQFLSTVDQVTQTRIFTLPPTGDQVRAEGDGEEDGRGTETGRRRFLQQLFW